MKLAASFDLVVDKDLTVKTTFQASSRSVGSLISAVLLSAILVIPSVAIANTSSNSNTQSTQNKIQSVNQPQGCGMTLYGYRCW